jgi:hypothetical protein
VGNALFPDPETAGWGGMGWENFSLRHGAHQGHGGRREIRVAETSIKIAAKAAHKEVSMKKSLFIAAIAAVLLLALVTGCKHDPEPTPVPTPTPTPTPQLPTANAGSDFEHNVTTGGASITLSGSGNVTGGTIASYAWSCTGKPVDAADPSFSNAATASPTVSGFNKLGEYQFTLKVTDNKGAESAASTVKAALVRTASTTLNIAANSFTPTPVTELDFIPSYTSVSNSTDFPTTVINSVLTYTVTVVNHEGDYTHTWNSTVDSFDGKIPVRSEYETDLATFTQTFYQDGQAKGSRTLEAMVDNNRFLFGLTYSSTGSIPAINGISISRKITSGNM